MLNNVSLVGRITKEPELRYTPNGNATCSFSLAVDRGAKDAQGNRQADFINCVAWKQSAEFIGNFIKKGYLMGVTGSIQTRNYQNQQGNTVYITEVLCNRVVSLQPKDDTQQQQQAPQQNGYQQNGYQQNGGNYNNQNGYTQNGATYNNQQSFDPTNKYGANRQQAPQQNQQQDSMDFDMDDKDLPF